VVRLFVQSIHHSVRLDFDVAAPKHSAFRAAFRGGYSNVVEMDFHFRIIAGTINLPASGPETKMDP
jgi:hypothetical protein